MLTRLQGLPKDWQIMINNSGITKKEQEQNPQVFLTLNIPLHLLT
jgi:hypothetical protein